MDGLAGPFSFSLWGKHSPPGICQQLRGCARLLLVMVQPCSRVVQAASLVCHSVRPAFSEDVDRLGSVAALVVVP